MTKPISRSSGPCFLLSSFCDSIRESLPSVPTPEQLLTPDPVVIVEILSPSTENRDRKVKLPDYRTLPSVEAIVLIDQQQFYCEVHHRLEDDRWQVDLLREPEARLRLPGIGFDQPLSALYANVRFPEPQVNSA